MEISGNPSGLLLNSLKKSFKRRIQLTLNSLGYNLVKIPDQHGQRSLGLPTKGFDIEDEFIDSFDSLRGIASSSWDTYYSLWKSVDYVLRNQISGDIVECGVEKGAGLVTIANCLTFNNAKRKIWAYDTYKGMSEPTDRDYMVPGHLAKDILTSWSKRDGIIDFCYGSLSEVKDSIITRSNYSLEHFKFIEGKVEDTIPNVLPNRISVLRLDTDWYESTFHELTYLYPLLSKNGIIMIDDYGCWNGAREAVRDYFKNKVSPFFVMDSQIRSRIAVKV